MKKVLLVLCIIVFSQNLAKALRTISSDALCHGMPYVEERIDKVKIKHGKKKDPLKYSCINIGDGIMSGAATLLGNKFTAGTGVVDVTNQVERAVRRSLKKVFYRQPEYQRHKTATEILNANLVTHRLTDSFLSQISQEDSLFRTRKTKQSKAFVKGFNFGSFFGGVLNGFGSFFGIDLSSYPGILEITESILQKPRINEIFGKLQLMAKALVIIITMFIIFTRLGHNDFSLSHIALGPLYSGLGIFILINLVGELMHIFMTMLFALNSAVQQSLEGTMINPQFQLIESWNNLLNKSGYMPAIILSVVDTLGQFFVYFFIAGLVLHIVIGKIISPFWSLALMSSSLRSNAINSFVEWAKTTITISFIPVVYLIIRFLVQEFDSANIYMLNISLSIASFIYLPFISNIILNRGHGVWSSAFSGYQIVADTINNSYQNLASIIETNHDRSNYDYMHSKLELENAKVKKASDY